MKRPFPYSRKRKITRIKQRLRISGLRIAQHRLGIARLDDFPTSHHCHSVSKACNGLQSMGNVEDAFYYRYNERKMSMEGAS